MNRAMFSRGGAVRRASDRVRKTRCDARYADCDRECEVVPLRTWLLETGRRRIGLIDPAEVPTGGTKRGGTRRER